MKWTTRAFINNRPIEEYSNEEVDDFFKDAWDRAFRIAGYEPYLDDNETKSASKVEIIVAT